MDYYHRLNKKIWFFY